MSGICLPRFIPFDDFPGCPEVEEDGKTFEENAVKKARAVSKYAKMPALADDSGLEVYALGGAPGVFSARYAGKGASDRDNTEKLLNEMSSVPNDNRGARFVCCIALAFPDGEVETFAGYAEGRIGTKPKGANGFGYDPVFIQKGMEGHLQRCQIRKKTFSATGCGACKAL